MNRWRYYNAAPLLVPARIGRIRHMLLTVRDIRLIARPRAQRGALCLLLPSRAALRQPLFVTQLHKSAVTVHRAHSAPQPTDSAEYYKSRPGLLASQLLRTLRQSAGQKMFCSLYETVLLHREQEQTAYIRTHPTTILRLLKQAVWLTPPTLTLRAGNLSPAAPTRDDLPALTRDNLPAPTRADAPRAAPLPPITDAVTDAVMRRIEGQLRAENLRRGR